MDSDELAEICRRDLIMPRHIAAELGQSAVAAARAGVYQDSSGRPVVWRDAVKHAMAAKISLPHDHPLPPRRPPRHDSTIIQVANETTMVSAQRAQAQGLSPLALNFANGIHPGGGFLNGALAQEECLCRSSALYLTLEDDLMYEFHGSRRKPDSSDWCILSPAVPFFRRDDGSALDQPWLLDVITCAAPYAPGIGQPRSRKLFKTRIHRVLSIASFRNYESLILGAWGCGAFGNDPRQTALDFRDALENEFRGAFSHAFFAVADWSPERKFLGPFRDVFCSQGDCLAAHVAAESCELSNLRAAEMLRA